MKFIFDVDGTLTPSRLSIDDEFERFFLGWIKDKDVYLLTGSDMHKTIEQVGEDIWKSVTKSYQSAGNVVYSNGVLESKSDFKVGDDLTALLYIFLETSKWSEKYSNHIEQRTGLLNFSTIGRGCTQEARERYYEWDNKEKEREGFCEKIMNRFPELEASVGGQISIDIHLKGKNKSQVLDFIKGDVSFFGDKCKPGGNDYSIVERLQREGVEKRNYKIYDVLDWKETYKILRGLKKQ